MKKHADENIKVVVSDCNPSAKNNHIKTQVDLMDEFKEGLMVKGDNTL